MNVDELRSTVDAIRRELRRDFQNEDDSFHIELAQNVLDSDVELRTAIDEHVGCSAPAEWLATEISG